MQISCPLLTRYNITKGKGKYKKQQISEIVEHINNIKYKTSSNLESLNKVKISSKNAKDISEYSIKDAIDAMLKYSDDAITLNKNIETLDKAAAEKICMAADCDAAIFAFNPGKFRKGLTVEKLYDMLPYGNRIAVVSVDRETALKILKLRRKRLGEFFAAGDFNRDKIRLALSDYLFFALPELSGKEGRITGIFERDVLIEAWKKQEY